MVEETPLQNFEAFWLENVKNRVSNVSPCD